MPKVNRKVKALSWVLLVTVVLGAFSGSVYAEKSISQLEQEKAQLEDEIAELDVELVDILAEIEGLEAEISALEAEIEELGYELQAAKDAEERQYQNMKVRMKYLYEHGNDNLLTIFLESGSIGDFINRVEYANAIYEYDRNLLDSYVATQVEIEEMQTELESQKAVLKSEKNSLAAKKSSLNSMIAAKKKQVANFDKQLAAAREAARKKAEEEARRRAAEQASANAAASGQKTGVNPAQRTNVSGSSVVSYAMQFVGNPYVWGGTSLTEGCDCSGFVQQVYKNFGISLGAGRATSASMRTVGQEVSFDCLKAGDIVCYPGHVGIYTGSGTIVEAQSTRAGITANRSVTCRPIVAIRRVI